MLKQIQDILVDAGALTPLTSCPPKATGDYGTPLFSMAASRKESPQSVYQYLNPKVTHPFIKGTQFEGGYLTLSLDWVSISKEYLNDLEVEIPCPQKTEDPVQKILLEYCSPNTNKALHIGHLRNNTLGAFLLKILALDPNKDVISACLINDRGIHVCKSMLMYMKYPDAFKHIEKGDHFVGAYYAMYNEHETPELEAEARSLLIKWEAGDPDVRALWLDMREKVLKGFAKTNARLGVSFQRVDFESDLYEKGKDQVLEALSLGVCHLNEKGQVAFDLSKVGMEGEKILLREDGTTFYLTQDIGVASDRAKDLIGWDSYYYVVGDEQAYHFQTLAKILPHVCPEFKGSLRHIAYGMVELPEGRMQSRAGRVILADDLMDALKGMAYDRLDKDLPENVRQERAEKIGMAALKFYLLDAVSTSKIRFDMEAALNPTGRSGAYILYTYARLQGVISKNSNEVHGDFTIPVTPLVKDLLKLHFSWEDAIMHALRNLDSGALTTHLFKLARLCNTIYNDPDHIVKNMNDQDREGMVRLFTKTAAMIKSTCDLLGIEVLEVM